MDSNNIQKNKLYPLREALEYIPGINNVTTFRQLITKDLEQNENRRFQVIILQRNAYKRYYMKGSSILRYLAKN
jgi:hypothetical protein